MNILEYADWADQMNDAELDSALFAMKRKEDRLEKDLHNTTKKIYILQREKLFRISENSHNKRG